MLISNPIFSRTHTVTEADMEGCTVHEVKSSNGTKKVGVRLWANVRSKTRKNIANFIFLSFRHNLESGEQLVFGDGCLHSWCGD